MAGCLEVSARQVELFDLCFAVLTLLLNPVSIMSLGTFQRRNSVLYEVFFFSQASASLHIFSFLWWQGTSQKKFRTNVTNAL